MNLILIYLAGLLTGALIAKIQGRHANNREWWGGLTDDEIVWREFRQPKDQ